jgi:hypothetical protein
LIGLGFTKILANTNLYCLFDRFDLLVLILYLDDLILIGSSEKLIAWCKIELARVSDMKDIDLMHYFLGLEVWQVIGEVFLGHEKYTTKILKWFQMMDYILGHSHDSKFEVTCQLRFRFGGSFGAWIIDWLLMYLVNTRLDFFFVVNHLS